MHVYVFLSFQKQYHSKIDELIEESVKEMLNILVAKVNVFDMVKNAFVQHLNHLVHYNV